MVSNRWLAFFSAILALASCLFSCQEDEHDYVYLASNNSDVSVMLRYRLTGRSFPDSLFLLPGQSDTLGVRSNVTGDGIWDIETSDEVYMFKSLEASDSASSRFSDNLCLRRFWGSVSSCGGLGVYTLNITNQTFELHLVPYSFTIVNNTDRIMSYSYSDGSVRVQGENLWPGDRTTKGPYLHKRRFVTDLYDTTNVNSRVSQLSLSSLCWYLDQDTLFSRNLNPNRRSSWSFLPTVDSNGDSIGAYTLNILPSYIQ